jgi:two-component system response regulator CpxR
MTGTTSQTESHCCQVLIVDDDEKFCRLLREYLRPFGYVLREAYSGLAGMRQITENEFDVIILDLMLPGMDGLEVLRRLGPNRRVPILMLTARGEESDRIVGLELGADDYLSKTASPREILAHLRAMTRRSQGQSPLKDERNHISVGELSIDTAARTAKLKDEVLSLTSFEFDLLHALACSAGRIRSRDQLLQEIASRPQSVFDRSIDVHISSLRRKLQDDPRDPDFIVTIRNTGYMMRRRHE